MKSKPFIQLISALILLWLCQERTTSGNPISFDPTASPFIGMPQMHPLQAPMLYSPYSQMQMPGQFMFGSPLMPMPFAETNRRSIPGMHRAEKFRGSRKEPMDEQKALGDLPVSFIDPEEPQTISERISDSFSALGEGVRNHFRSITENFSDTLDDIKDAWKTSGDNSNKRG